MLFVLTTRSVPVLLAQRRLRYQCQYLALNLSTDVRFCASTTPVPALVNFRPPTNPQGEAVGGEAGPQARNGSMRHVARAETRRARR